MDKIKFSFLGRKFLSLISLKGKGQVRFKMHPDPSGLELFGWAGTATLIMALLLLSGCTKIAATGERHFSLVGEEQEVQMGAESDEEIIETMGLYPSPELQNYVQALGARLAAATERPDLPWTFRVVDDNVVNAFALPGGYVYITRGIMARFENEAQLAGVLGHEIAHVTAKHAVIRLSRSMLAQLGFGIARVVEPGLEPFAPLAGAGLQLLFLKYSREDETEADLLGIRYMARVEENPRELMDVMAMLARNSAAEKKGVMPQWASTHPLPENRLEVIGEQLQTVPAKKYEPVERESYLRRLEGMVYGDDPREGYTRDNLFYHPTLRFRLDFPAGWEILNQKRVVVAISPERQATIQMTLAKLSSSAEGIKALFGKEGIAGQSAEQVTINGLPAATGTFLARTDKGVIAGRAMFIEYAGRIYQLVGYSLQPQWRQFAGDIRQTMESFAELTDPKFLQVEPYRLAVVQIEAPVTLADWYRANPAPVQLEEIARLNQMEADDLLAPGRLLKTVVGGPPD